MIYVTVVRKNEKLNKCKNNYTVFMPLFDVPFCKMLIKNSLFRLILASKVR